MSKDNNPKDHSSPPDMHILDELLDHAELALENGDLQTALEGCQRALDSFPRNPDALFLMAECYREIDHVDQALDAYRRCVLIDSHYSAAWSGLGLMHLVLRQTEEANRSFNRAIREDPSNPEPWWGRAMLRERRHDFDGADRDLARAARLDPEGYPYPAALADNEVEQIVQSAIADLHPALQEYLGNVAILLDEVPSDDILEQYDPPVLPGELLGYFNGASLIERSFDNPWSNLPSAIMLFRRNLQRYATNKEQLVDELRTTFLHEVGHFLGLQEEDLAERGLD